MSDSLMVAAAITIAKPRLQTYLTGPVKPASAWPEKDWVGVTEPWSDSEERSRYRAELVDAIEECDSWIDGDYASVWHGLADEDELVLRFDETTGSLMVEFSSRVDFELPTLVWAFAVLRGVADFMAGDESGLVTVTVDWNDDTALMRLAPDQSSFLDRGRDALTYRRARDREIDIQSAVADLGRDESAAETIRRLANR